jgi:MarR family transcriptional regulator, lower aerobic nicotinate degradation pathway regulator
MPDNNVTPIRIVSRRPDKQELEYDFTKQVGHLLRKAYQAHIAIFQQTCADPQLTAAQLAVLCALRDKGASSLTEIGNTVVMDPATVRGIVERLMERKLIGLMTDKNDRRRSIANLTKKGHQLISKLIPSVLAISDQTMGSLNAVERVALLYLLNKISGTVSETEEAAEAKLAIS